jgi:hypothetical protein
MTGPVIRNADLGGFLLPGNSLGLETDECLMVPIVTFRLTDPDRELDDLGMRDRKIASNPLPNHRVGTDSLTELGCRRCVRDSGHERNRGLWCMPIQNPRQILGLHKDNISARERGSILIRMLWSDIASSIVDVKDDIREERESVIANVTRSLRPERTGDDLLKDASPLCLDVIDVRLAEVSVVYVLERLQELIEMGLGVKVVGVR